MEHINLTNILKQCIAEQEGKAGEKGITIQQSLETSIELHSDKDKIHEIVGNLLSNAIKFSYNSSTIKISLHRIVDKASISIADEGQGMTQEDQKRLFTKFARLSSTPTAGEDSTGLGLAIVKRLTEEIGGTITCTSQKDVGTQFIVELPLK